LVRDHTIDVFELVGFLIEGFEIFALGGLANVNSSIDFTGVEGVKRLADFVEDVVCNINDVVDGAEANGFELLGKPIRAGSNFDSFDLQDRIEWASGGIASDNSQIFREFGGMRFYDRLRFGMKKRGKFTGESGVGEEVGTVRCDLDFDERIRIKKIFYRSSDFKIGIKNEKSIFLIGETDFGPGSEHALRFDPAHFGFSNLKSAGKNGSGEAAGDSIADFVVSSTTHNLTKRAFTSVNLGDFEAVGVRVLNRFLYLGHHNLVALDTDFLEAFDFNASEGEEVADFFERAGAKIEAFFEPSKRNVHKARRRKAREAFFNRKSKKSRLGAFWSVKEWGSFFVL
jgi:hypothetical protein